MLTPASEFYAPQAKASSSQSKCQWQGCDKVATHHPKICVPGVGMPVEIFKPLDCMTSLVACAEHALAFNVVEWLEQPTPNGNFKNKDVFTLLTRGRAAPDFPNAFVEAIPIGSEEAQNFATTRQPEPDGANQPIPTGG